MLKQDGITINDVLKMECMYQSKIIAGLKGLKNTVTRVNIMADIEILDWVSPGEFLLLTSYSFNIEDVEWQKEFIVECSKKNLSGIGIKIYPNVDGLPAEVIDIANSLNIPIINISHSVPFSDIMTFILKEIFNKQAAFLEKMEDIHKRIMDLILTEASIGEIVNVVHENVNNPVLIKLEFPDRMIMNFDSIDEELKKGLLNNVEKFILPAIYRRNGEKIHISKEFIAGKYIKRISKPIVVKDNVYGCIFTWAVTQPFGDFDYSVIEASTSAISMEVIKKLSVREVESRYRQEFLDDLLAQDEKRKAKAYERAVFFNLSADLKYVVVAINIKSLNNGVKKHQDLQVKQILTRMVQMIEKLIDEFKFNGIVVGNLDNIQILLSSKDNKKMQSNLNELCNSIDKNLFTKFEFVDARMGIGRCYDGLKLVYKSYVDAMDAINTGEILNEGRITYFENLGVYKILCQEHLQEELERFYCYAIESLVEYDKRKSTELIKTLEAYFTYNGNLKKMADMLFTHYNTISYRINRIEEISGVSLENASDRLSIEIALKIKHFLKR
jgi:PucR family transcriptional regulator, purine catabolism regulatory protein